MLSIYFTNLPADNERCTLRVLTQSLGENPQTGTTTYWDICSGPLKGKHVVFGAAAQSTVAELPLFIRSGVAWKGEDKITMVQSRGGVRSGPAAGEFVSRIEDPLQHILNCHEQIERRLVTLQHAAMTVAFSDGAMLKDAAVALSYELEVLHAIDTLHTEDEEKSLFPRLRIRMQDNPSLLEPLMLSLELQHQNEQAAFEKLKAAATTIGATGVHADKGSSIEDLVSGLAGICRPHMMLENDSLIPLARTMLTASDLEEIRGEMRQRWGMSQDNTSHSSQRNI